MNFYKSMINQKKPLNQIKQYKNEPSLILHKP